MKKFVYLLSVVCIFQITAIRVFAQQENYSNMQKTTYFVQKSEGLYAVARKFNVSVDDLCKWNNLPKDAQLLINQELIVYIPKTQKVSTFIKNIAITVSCFIFHVPSY